MPKFQDLTDFVERARRSRKYPDNTAYSLVAALRLYEAELNDEELASVEKFRDNFEPITRSVFSKNQSKFTASSLATYRSRVLKVLTDYEKYSDPLKMNSWNPATPVTRAPKQKAPKETKSTDIETEVSLTGKGEIYRIVVPLRPGIEALVTLPHDVSASEVSKIKKFLDASISE